MATAEEEIAPIAISCERDEQQQRERRGGPRERGENLQPLLLSARGEPREAGRARCCPQRTGSRVPRRGVRGTRDSTKGPDQSRTVRTAAAIQAPASP